MSIDRNLRPTARLLLALPIAAAAFSLAACAAPAERPSVSEVADGLGEFLETQGMTLSDEASTCFAEKLVDSKLSNETLGYIADGQDRQKDEADKDLTTKIIQDNADCATK